MNCNRTLNERNLLQIKHKMAYSTRYNIARYEAESGVMENFCHLAYNNVLYWVPVCSIGGNLRKGIFWQCRLSHFIIFLKHAVLNAAAVLEGEGERLSSFYCICAVALMSTPLIYPNPNLYTPLPRPLAPHWRILTDFTLRPISRRGGMGWGGRSGNRFCLPPPPPR